MFLYKSMTLLLLVISVITMTMGLRGRYFSQTGDAASYFDFLANRSGGPILTSDFTITSHSLYFYMLTVPTSEICDLAWTPLYSGISNFHWHAYLVSFVAFFIRIMPFDQLFISLGLLSLSYVFGIYKIFSFLRSRNKPLGIIAAACLTVLSWPALQEGFLGQPYLDRLLFGPAIAFVLAVYDTKQDSKIRSINFLVFFGISMLISERASIISGIIGLGLAFLCRKQNTRKFSLIVVSLSLLAVLWYFLWSSLFSYSDYYANNASFPQMLNNIKELWFGNRSTNFVTFMLMVGPILLFILLINRILFCLSLIAIAPNLLISIGGAELFGFYTHYHAMYVPFLSVFAVIAIAQMSKLASSLKAQNFLIFTLIFCNLFLYGNGNFPSNAQANLERLMKISGIKALVLGGPSKAAVRPNQELINIISESNLPTSVSAPESLWPELLYQNWGEIHYFPVGVGQDKVVLAPYRPDNLERPDISIYGMMPKEKELVWGACIQAKLDKEYKILKEISSYSTVWRVYQKN
jgi:hypothetical protein